MAKKKQITPAIDTGFTCTVCGCHDSHILSAMATVDVCELQADGRLVIGIKRDRVVCDKCGQVGIRSTKEYQGAE